MRQVIDLLNPVKPEPGKPPRSLMVRWNKKKRAFFVENLFTVECEELDDLLAVLEEGELTDNLRPAGTITCLERCLTF